MKIVHQRFDHIVNSLSPLESNWMDETAMKVMDLVKSVPSGVSFSQRDLESFIDTKSAESFQISMIMFGLFLGYSKDKMHTELSERLGAGGLGIKRYTSDKSAFIGALESMGLLEAITDITNTKPVWSDLLKERLRFGRGSAIQGQQRGRELEDFAEEIIRSVFGTAYEVRCSFQGVNGLAKCDFAIPSKNQPNILIEAKAYGATGSKMSDIIGDVDAIISAKRNDASLLLITDGLTWKSRANDLRKLIQRQNDGRITRIYTKNLENLLREDLKTLKEEIGI